MKQPGPRRAAGAAEGLAAGAAGAGLAWSVLSVLAAPEALAAAGAAAAGLNGLISGAAGIYAWRRARGWLCFALDSTWGLAGVSSGVVLHVVNLFYPDRAYMGRMSRRANRHVYEGGFTFRAGFVLALGNVVSCGGRRRRYPGGFLSGSSPAAARRCKLVDVHEGAHLFQNRVFGPFYPIGYGGWMILAGAAGLAAGSAAVLVARRTGGQVRLWPIVETFAYYDNPFEYWAYRKDGNWPPPGAHPRFVWGARRNLPDMTFRGGGP